MKLKKAELADILSFVMIITLFTACMVAMFFNNITQDRRSMVIEYLNREAMTLQTELNGYSENPNFCNMYENGQRIESPSRRVQIKNKAIEDCKNRIVAEFNKPRNASQLSVKRNDIKIEIIDDVSSRKAVAKVKITVKYTASFKPTYGDMGSNITDENGLLKYEITDTASRAIENPVRQKNL